MDYRTLESKVQELEKRTGELEDAGKGYGRTLRNVKNSPIMMGYDGKRFDLNESLDVVKLLGRIKELEGGVGADNSGFAAWLAGPPKLSEFENDEGFVSTFSESDPVFSAWRVSTPDISLFNNNVGYLTTAALSDEIGRAHV